MDEIKNGGGMPKGNTTCACGAGCRCGCGCAYEYGHGHRVIRWILGIVILVIVFAIGVKAGEFRDELRAAFGGYYRGYPMMQRVYNGGGAVPMGTQGSATGTSAAPMIPAQQ